MFQKHRNKRNFFLAKHAIPGGSNLIIFHERKEIQGIFVTMFSTDKPTYMTLNYKINTWAI